MNLYLDGAHLMNKRNIWHRIDDYYRYGTEFVAQKLLKFIVHRF